VLSETSTYLVNIMTVNNVIKTSIKIIQQVYYLKPIRILISAYHRGNNVLRLKTRKSFYRKTTKSLSCDFFSSHICSSREQRMIQVSNLSENLRESLEMLLMCELLKCNGHLLMTQLKLSTNTLMNKSVRNNKPFPQP